MEKKKAKTSSKTVSKTAKTAKSVKTTKSKSDNAYTHIAVVLDRSGSMSVIAKDMIGGFEKFLGDQKKVKGKAMLTLARFNDTYESVHDFIDLKSISTMELHPCGCTALLDAMGKTIVDVKSKIEAMKKKDRPTKTIFVFVTDGAENASKEFSKDQVFKLIEGLKTNKSSNYDFVFMGANQDAIQVGQSLGVSGGSSLTFGASAKGASKMFDSLSSYTTSYRCCAAGAKGASFSQADRDAQNNQKTK